MILTIIATITSLMLTFVTSPLQLVILVMGLSFISALIMSALSTWFALILVIMYIGGMLVAFAYFIALCPNQLDPVSALAALPISVSFFYSSDYKTAFFMELTEMTDIYKMINLQTIIFLGVILFLAMVVVVKLVTRSAGPLRPFKGL